MKTNKEKYLDNLKEGDYIAFQWDYGIFGKDIIVDRVTSINNDEVLIHFLYGYKSEAEWIKKDKIIAIGDNNFNGKIDGWSGNFNILIPEHELLTK